MRATAGSSSDGYLLVLDAMGVIFEAADDVVELLVPFVAERGGSADPDKIKRLYVETSLGKMEPDAFWEDVGLDPAVEDEYLAGHRLREGMLDFLGDPPTCVGALWCISNDVSRWSRRLRWLFELERYFSGFVISGDVGSRKPDAGIFAAFLKQAGYPAARCVFVDDRAANLETAARLGFHTVLFGTPANGVSGEPQAVSSFVQLRSCLARVG